MGKHGKPKYPSKVEWINTLGNYPIMGYHTIVKMNEIELHQSTWKNLNVE